MKELNNAKCKNEKKTVFRSDKIMPKQMFYIVSSCLTILYRFMFYPQL